MQYLFPDRIFRSSRAPSGAAIQISLLLGEPNRRGSLLQPVARKALGSGTAMTRLKPQRAYVATYACAARYWQWVPAYQTGAGV